MKNGKKPTRREKLLIAAAGSNPNDWLVTKRLPHTLHLQHRYTTTIKVIPVN